MPPGNKGDERERMGSGMKALLREIDRRIARSKRPSLMQIGYRGERLERMLKALRGNPRKKKETDDG